MTKFFRSFLVAAILVFTVQSYADEAVKANATTTASVAINSGVGEVTDAPHFTMTSRCIAANGTVKWEEVHRNTVVTQGKNDLLDKYFKGSAYTATWYLIPKGAGSIVAGDTYASHAGWTEITAYSAGTRPTITFGTTSAGSNTASAVTYSINGTATIAGACVLAGSSTKSDIASGTGILYSCSDFAASRSVVSGDSLQVTLTVTD
jgi:hypothetical protein